MSFENIMLSASNQTQKAMDFMIHLYKVYRIDKSIEAEYRLVVDCWGQGKERMGGQSLLSRRLLGEKQEWEEYYELKIVVMVVYISKSIIKNTECYTFKSELYDI